MDPKRTCCRLVANDTVLASDSSDKAKIRFSYQNYFAKVRPLFPHKKNVVFHRLKLARRLQRSTCEFPRESHHRVDSPPIRPKATAPRHFPYSQTQSQTAVSSRLTRNSTNGDGFDASAGCVAFLVSVGQGQAGRNGSKSPRAMP